MGWTTHSVNREWKSLAILEKADKSLKIIGTMLKDQVLQSFRIGFEFQLCPKTAFPFEKCGYYLLQCILASSKWHHVSCLQLLLYFFENYVFHHLQWESSYMHRTPFYLLSKYIVKAVSLWKPFSWFYREQTSIFKEFI